MKKLDLYKMNRDTSYFVKGQKVWCYISTGALAYLCLGRFRGHGRWVLGWVHVVSANPNERYLSKPDCDWVGEVEVSDEFYNYLSREIGIITKNKANSL